MTDEVAVRISLCLPVRYSAAVTVIVSGSGLTVTEVVTGAEVSGAVFLSVIVSCTIVGTTLPTGSVGAVKLTVAPVGGFWVTVKLSNVPAGAYVTVKVSGVSAGTLGSAPLTVKFPAAPENTEMGATGLTVGACAALTVMVELAVELPQALVAVSDKGTTVCARSTGAW